MEEALKKPNFKIFLGILWVILICFIGYICINEYTLQTGEEVFLETLPVDPRDVLRGDYVILSYAIETDEKVQNFLSENTLERWDNFYIHLRKDENNVWQVKDVSLQQPHSDILYITGEVTVVSWWRENISFNIGKYFVPEWTGRTIERIRWDMKVLVRINTNGVAKIVDIYYKWEKIDPKDFQL